MNEQKILPPTPPVESPRWLDGVTRTPRVGDVWVAQWDGEDLGLLLLVAVRESHVLAWPLTAESVTPSAPCFRVSADWLDQTLVAWPEAEASLSYALLSRGLGTVATDDALVSLYRHIRDASVETSVDFYDDDSSSGAMDALKRVCDHINYLAGLDWPDEAAGDVLLDPEFVENSGLEATVLLGLLGGPPGGVREVLAGKRRLPEEVASALAERYETTYEAVVAPMRGDVVRHLKSPRWKGQITGIVTDKDQSEGEVRSQAWGIAQRAARQAGRGDEALAERISAALDEIASDGV